MASRLLHRVRIGAVLAVLVGHCPTLHEARFLARADAATEPPPPRQVTMPAVAALVLPLAPAATPVALYNVNTRETLELAVPPDGVLAAADAERLASFMRCKRTGRQKKLHPGVVALVADVASAYPGRVIEVVSGYRAPPYGKPHSKHFTGHAVDLRVRGVRSADVRDHLWKTHAEVGVGHYAATDFIHVNWRPGEPDMAWTVGKSGRYRYHPGWSIRARALARSSGA